jgi:sialic acid synthase SpsE
MTIVAEIGTAHGGSLQKAYDLIDEAHESGADAIKFQWVYADEILHPDTGFVTLPGGKVRLYDRFRELEVKPEFFASCLEYTHKRGCKFICSPFGLRSFRELMDIHPDAIKIASPEVNHFPLLHAIASYTAQELSSAGRITPVILSSGVSKLGDLEKAIDILTAPYTAARDIPSPLTLLHCITSYPAPEAEYNVRCVETLRSIFGVATGISDHSLDPVLVPVLTTAMGGTMIEKHITLSKKTDGLDDPVALEAEQFAHMVYCVHQAEAVIERLKKDAIATQQNNQFPCNALAAQNEIVRQLSDEYGAGKVAAVLGTGVKRLAPSETANYGRTNRSLHFMHAMKCGDVIGSDDIAVLRTEKVLTPGMSPEFLDDIIGCVLQRDVTAGEGVRFEQVKRNTR